MSAPTGNAELEDLAVGSGGLSSGRDRDLPETAPPRDTANWISVSMQHLSSVGYMPPARIRNVTLWLPKDRKLTMHIVEVYFKQLNFHRPVLIKRDFEHVLNMLYEKQPVTYDPGFVCSLYLVLALGTMSELNKIAGSTTEDLSRSPDLKKKLLDPAWPENEELFERALAVKPDLRVTVSSLQALILLHWYLYCEVSLPYRLLICFFS